VVATVLREHLPPQKSGQRKGIKDHLLHPHPERVAATMPREHPPHQNCRQRRAIKDHLLPLHPERNKCRRSLHLLHPLLKNQRKLSLHPKIMQARLPPEKHPKPKQRTTMLKGHLLLPVPPQAKPQTKGRKTMMMIQMVQLPLLRQIQAMMWRVKTMNPRRRL
jgi:hypothetical protein